VADEIKSNYLDIIGLITGLREIIEGASRSLHNFPAASRAQLRRAINRLAQDLIQAVPMKSRTFYEIVSLRIFWVFSEGAIFMKINRPAYRMRTCMKFNYVDKSGAFPT